MPDPDIAAIYARNRAAFVHHTPFGALLASDLAALIRTTARDAGVTQAQVLETVVNHG